MTTATTSAVVAPIATIFAISDGFVLPALEGLTHDELWKAPTDRNNAMLWIADELGFFALHESYHVGQLGYIRKGLGTPASRAEHNKPF